MHPPPRLEQIESIYSLSDKLIEFATSAETHGILMAQCVCKQARTVYTLPR
jgi:hypothetical protein